MLTAPSKYNLCFVSADYRLAPQTRFPGILADCKSAIEFVRSSPTFRSATHNRVNTSKLILSGSSAGGWLSLLCGTGIGFAACKLEPPLRVTAIAAIYPITDMLDPFWTTKQRPVSYMDRVIEQEEVEPFINPGDEKTASSAADERRSIFYHYMVQEGLFGSLLLDGTGISPDTFSIAPNLRSRGSAAALPPIYIIHGNIDDKVPHRQATDLVGALEEVGAKVEYHELDGADHLFDKDPKHDMKSMYEFMTRVVNG